MNTNYNQIRIEYDKLEEQIHSIQEQIKHLPEGKLLCTQNGQYIKWYHSDGRHQHYIPKKQRSYAEKLAFKKYLMMLLSDLEQEKLAMQMYLKTCPVSSKAEELLSASTEYQSLLSPYFSPKSKELSEWMQEDYERNLSYSEQCIYKCPSGNMVRSKSEMIIDTALFLHHIPFRYECSLQLEQVIIFPDFTIRHPKTGELYYWEHFGLMDQSIYSKNAFNKMQLYTNHGIIPSHQLITTFETKEYPLTASLVEKIVQDHFL